MEEGTFIEQANALGCPKCGAKNWYSNGDPRDLTGFDVEYVRCWKCGCVFWVPGALEIRETMRDSLDVDESEAEQGQETLR